MCTTLQEVDKIQLWIDRKQSEQRKLMFKMKAAQKPVHQRKFNRNAILMAQAQQMITNHRVTLYTNTL